MRTCSIALLVSAMWLSALLPAYAQTEKRTENAAPSKTAIQLSRAVVTGIRVGAESAQAKNAITPGVFDCVNGLDETVLAPVYQRLMIERMSAEDIQKLDAFYGSEAGERFYKWTLNQLRTQQGLPIRTPIDLAQAEQDRANAFHAEGPGKVLNDMTGDGDAAAAKALQEEINKLVSMCVSG